MQKIMFNDRCGLTARVLVGRKTMTRRVVSDTLLDRYAVYDDYCASVGTGGLPIERYYEKEFFAGQAPLRVGDVVAIAQAYQNIRPFYFDEWQMEQDWFKRGWNNKMFVKSELMVHHIKITSIKVERLQDISDDDCLREGICQIKSEDVPQINEKGAIYYTFIGVTGIWTTPRAAFAALIDKVGKRGTWASNPWVFCYSFELVD